MKKSITGVVALLAGAFVAHSQGTVSFANYLNGGSYTYVSLGTKALGGTAAGTGVAANDTGAGSEWTVALYGAAGAGDAASTLLQLNTALTGGTPVTANLETGGGDTTAGTWLSTAIAVVPSAAPGTIATVQVYAWYNDNGTLTTYAMAKAAGAPTGFSSTANTGALGGQGPSGPPATATPLPTGTAGLGNITVSGIPEPSTIALGVMGASAFLLRLRKKQ